MDTEYASVFLNEFFEISAANINDTWVSMELLDHLAELVDSAPEGTNVLDQWISYPKTWEIIQEIYEVTAEFNDYTALIEMTLNNSIIADLGGKFDGPIVQQMQVLPLEMLVTREVIREFQEQNLEQYTVG